MKGEILVIDSYATTPSQVSELAAAVGEFAQWGRDICLVSHVPIPSSMVTPAVKFVVCDSNNLLGEPQTVFFKFMDFEVRYQPADRYHGPAVYGNLYNALRVLAGRYEWVHFVECDVLAEDVARHMTEGMSQVRADGEIQVAGYPFPAVEPEFTRRALQTLVLSLRPEIVEKLPLVTTNEDYAKAAAGRALVLEIWLPEVLSAAGVTYRQLKGSAIRHASHAGGEHVLIRCRQHNGLFAVFVGNRAAGPVEVKFSTGGTARVSQNAFTWKPDQPGAAEVVIVEGTGAMRYPVEEMRMGIFKREGHDLCPDWR